MDAQGGGLLLHHAGQLPASDHGDDGNAHPPKATGATGTSLTTRAPRHTRAPRQSVCDGRRRRTLDVVLSPVIPIKRSFSEQPGDRPAAAPHRLRVLAVWAVATAASLIILRLSAQDTPVTPWAQAAPTWAEHLSFWDSGWYNRISQEGYPSELPVDANGHVVQNAWAFMPLLPALAGALSWTGWSFYACAALVATAASAGAAVVMDWWLAPAVGERASLWAVALAWSSPCAVVLQVPYAESLGLLFTAAALALAVRGGPGGLILATASVALAAFSRPIGVPLTLALGAWWLWEVLGERFPGAWRLRVLPEARPLSGGQRLRLLALTIFSAACALAWPALAWLATGRADAYTATETAWRYGSLAPFTPWLARSGWWVGPGLGMLLLVGALVVVATVLSAPSLRRLGPGPWFWCAGYMLYLLVFFDPTTSVFRILLPMAPIAWALASSMSTRRRIGLLAACMVGQLFWISWVWDLSVKVTQWVP